MFQFYDIYSIIQYTQKEQESAFMSHLEKRNDSILNQIFSIGNQGNNFEKENIINFYTQNVPQFASLFYITTDFFPQLLQKDYYFDTIFTNKTFMISLIRESNSSFINNLLNKKDISCKQRDLMFENDIYKFMNRKIKQKPEVFATLEEALKEPSFFIFPNDIFIQKKTINNYSFINCYNINLYQYNYIYTNTAELIDYSYYNSKTLLLNLIINVKKTKEQEKSLIRIFLYKEHLFSYFLINNDEFFNFIKNNNSFLDIIFTHSNIIRSVMETGNIPGMSELLNIKINQPNVLYAIKQAITKNIVPEASANEKILYDLYHIRTNSRDLIKKTEPINVLYQVYSNIYAILKQQFANDKIFIKVLNQKLSIIPYIDNNNLYHTLINKLLQSPYTNEYNNIEDILTTILDDSKETLNEFINLCRNNTIYNKIIDINIMFFMKLQNNTKISYLISRPNFIELILLNTTSFFKHFEDIILTNIQENYKYSRTVYNLIQQQNSKYITSFVQSCKDVYLKHLITDLNKTNDTVLFINSLQEEEFVPFYKNNYTIFSEEIVLNENFYKFILKNEGPLDSLFTATTPKENFILFLMRQGIDNKAVASATASIITKKIENQTVLRLLSTKINLVESYVDVPEYRNIIEQCMKDIKLYDKTDLDLRLTLVSFVPKNNFLIKLKNDTEYTVDLMRNNDNFLYYLNRYKDLDSIFLNYTILKIFLDVGKTFKKQDQTSDGLFYSYNSKKDINKYTYYDLAIDNISPITKLADKYKNYKINKYEHNIKLIVFKVKTQPFLVEVLFNMINIFKSENKEDLYSYDDLLKIDYAFTMQGF